MKTYSMDYDQPGETNFYELYWSKTGLDTLKSYAWKDRTQKAVLTFDYQSGKQIESKEIPSELKNLNGFDWFIMKPNEVDE